MRQRLIILGSTGSIGTQALDVVAHVNALAERGASDVHFDVVGLAAGANASALAAQARALGVRDLALADTRETTTNEPSAREASTSWPDGSRVRRGPDAAERLVCEVECDIVLAAVVGVAGLASTLAAAELGRTIALANKETLVAAGALVTRTCARTGARLLPVDSEHAALFQALCEGPAAAPPFAIDASRVRRVTLTASGGPFRTWPREAIASATVAQALAHPTWRMGSKVTIDCASLMNKGLEVIEAHWLFGVGPDALGVLVHPQSIVHAMVEMRDGSVVMGCAKPDMRTPIQQALLWPRVLDGAGARLAPADLARLEFAEPDHERFPALGLAYDALRAGGAMGAVLNAANEVAVAAFLGNGRHGPALAFGAMAGLVARTMDRVGVLPALTLEDVLEADRRAREVATGLLRP